ncbi:MAG: hypothetical protein HY447_03110 [Candidatus Omnitrophica bacterium]|nr:hypothetical protein [Candidatus Omnitrophota bacterium]
MAIRCPKCGQEHDVALFQFDRKIRCTCGKELDLSLIETIKDFERYFESVEEQEKAREIQQEASRICQMILDENCPEVDIEIAKAKLKDRVVELFPDKLSLYEMIYEARFKRLWEQFRR